MSASTPPSFKNEATHVTNIEETEVSLTLKEFCAAERICLASYYKMRARGHAPIELRVPGTKIIRITPAARHQWHQMMQAMAQGEAARLEAARVHAASVERGKLAARSPRHYNATRPRKARGRVAP
jgi:hypothetical protein